MEYSIRENLCIPPHVCPHLPKTLKNSVRAKHSAQSSHSVSFQVLPGKKTFYTTPLCFAAQPRPSAQFPRFLNILPTRLNSAYHKRTHFLLNLFNFDVSLSLYWKAKTPHSERKTKIFQMEFKFRAVDKRQPNYFLPSSSSFNPSSGQGIRPNPNFNRNRPDSIQWELEKAQIREEIIASEMARRRALEAEVRRELMAEREMAAWHRARETSLPFEHMLTVRLDPRLPFMHHHFNNHHRWRPEQSFNLFPPPPLPMMPPQLTEILDSEVKDTSEGNKNKLIILAKPDPNRVVGAKRKTPPPAGTGELPLPLISLKKIPNEEWSCAICQVSATSEKGLIEHLQGRKHKAKEARLRAERMEKSSNTNTTTLPKKPRLPQLNKNMDGSDQKLEDREKLKNKKDELLIKREKKAERFRKKHGPMQVERTPELSKKEKYKFWCQMCLVGAHSEVVMEAHKKGKRHIARLLDLDENNAAAPATSTNNKVTELARFDGSQMPKVTDVVVDEANEKITNAPGSVSSKFWCQMCLFGAQSEVVLETHKKGKRHIARLLELDENRAAAPATSTINTITEQARLDGVQMPKVADVVADKANEKLMDVPEADGYNLSPVVS
ncbi:uncharacterized protein LOC111284446 [Durio zibethinus]|uniref:Uncharacterized protein LOC111284446 n=1 Tax=Durio zibethinus TaxID=66656 RepID=A0A6P5XKD2_DURZI|nr:uncharacterized protein LOC111284446 [Durio zibethinus]